MAEEVTGSYEGTAQADSFTTPREKDSRWAFDYALLMMELKARLHGGFLHQDNDGNVSIKWPDPEHPGKYTSNKPKRAISFMNDAGVENTLAIVNMLVTKIQKLGIHREQRVLAWCAKIDWEMSKLYFSAMMQENEENPDHINQYDLSPVKASNVIVATMNLVESNLSGGIDGQSLSMLGQSEKIIETRTSQPRQKILGII